MQLGTGWPSDYAEEDKLLGVLESSLLTLLVCPGIVPPLPSLSALHTHPCVLPVSSACSRVCLGFTASTWGSLRCMLACWPDDSAGVARRRRQAGEQ